MFAIVIQIIIFQCCFLAVYEWLLRKETFFTHNRIYLIATSILSILLPFLKINIFSKLVPQQLVENLPAILIGDANQSATSLLPILEITNDIQEQVEYMAITNVWFVGIVVFTLLLFSKCYTLYQLKKHNVTTKMGSYTVVTLENSDDAFSFFNTVYLGENLNKQEKETIFSHEKIHAKEMHSLDLLGFEILKIFFWFNPFIYLFQNRITEIHEFIADQKVAHTQQNYYQSLLAKTFGVQQFSIVNQFYSSTLIKKRIIMLTKQQSKTKQLVKYFSIIPLIVGMLVIASCKSVKERGVQKTPTTEVEKQEMDYSQKSEVPFSKLDQSPVYPGCDQNDTKESLKKCFTQSISKYVTENFNTKTPGTEGLSGKQKILVMFKIDTSGNVIEAKARAPHPALQTEALRVINALPQMTPGKYNNKAVTVMYSLPIVFMIN